MTGLLRRLRGAPRADRRAIVEDLLRGPLAALAGHESIATIARRARLGPLTLLHATYDEPEPAQELEVQVTFHFGEAGLAGDVRDEVRGSALARIDDDGGVRWIDVEAERVRLVDDVETEAGGVEPAD